SPSPAMRKGSPRRRSRRAACIELPARGESTAGRGDAIFETGESPSPSYFLVTRFLGEAAAKDPTALGRRHRFLACRLAAPRSRRAATSVDALQRVHGAGERSE